jgi:regulator of CtrA degradation
MGVPVDRATTETANTVSFVHFMTRSARFTELFAEGMQLVEEAAAYLDGPGRREAEFLSKTLRRAYSAESMRLTTRLMQIASWLLIRRAVGAGEMPTTVALPERVKVKVSAQNIVSRPSVFAQLPDNLQRLTKRSLRLQSRILHLDRMINISEQDNDPHAARRGLDQQFERLQLAYSSPGA